MPLPEFTRKLIETRLDEYCSRKFPAHTRDQIRLSYNMKRTIIPMEAKCTAPGIPDSWNEIGCYLIIRGQSDILSPFKNKWSHFVWIPQFPNAVICLVSALAYHNLTTQIPHAVFVAVSRDSRMPSLDHPLVRAHRFSTEAYQSGIEVHLIDGVSVKIYSPEKTLADCFKFRNKIGMDVVLEALKLYKIRKKFNLGELLRYAKICRVEQAMRPYLEVTV